MDFPGQASYRGFICPIDDQLEMWEFDRYPHKQSLGGGTHIGTRSLPGWRGDVITPLGNKSIDHTISILCDELFVGTDPPFPDGNIFGAHAALAWLFRNVGPYDESLSPNFFAPGIFYLSLIKDHVFEVCISDWKADVQLLDREDDNRVLRMQVDMQFKHWIPLEIDTSVLPRAPRKRRQRWAD